MKLTNEKLYALCKKYGAAARFWRQKFIGLLPEVNRRRLFEEKGVSSIFEFAAKLCGLSADQVRLALNLEKRFEDKPILKKMLEGGEVSINKLSRVVSIATPQNEEELAAKIKILPKSALEVWVKDAKLQASQSTNGQMNGARTQNGLFEPNSGSKSLPGQTSHPSRSENASVGFQIATDVQAEFDELYEKGIDVNELLREMLERRRAKIANKKVKIAEEIQSANQSPSSACSRYIPAQIKKLLHEEFGEKCSILTCRRPAQVVHHTQRFSLSQNHDPRFLAPLCKEHHVIAHSVDFKYHQVRESAIG